MTKRPRWYLIYYALAALDLITVLLGIYLNNKITDIYNQSVEESAIWAKRNADILHLSEIAISANEPGNRIFESGDIPAETKQLINSVIEYSALSKKINDELEQNISEIHFKKISTSLSNAKSALNDMVQQTYTIFEAIEKNDLILAGKNMSAMDSHYYRVLKSLANCNHIAADLQSDFFKGQRITVKKTQQWRVYTAIAIVLMIIGITFYGRLLAKQIRESEEARLTLEHNIELALLKSQAILDTTADAIISINASGIIETFNKGAEKIFGYTAEEIVDQNVKVLMPSSFTGEHDEYMQRYVNGGKPHIIGFEREIIAKRKNGNNFVAELSVSEIKLEDKLLFTGTLRDISHRKKVENMKNDFISTVSHELRTPLTAIHGVISLLDNEVMGEQTPQSKELISKALLNSERLKQLINDILDIQQMEAGKFDYTQEKIIVNELILNALDENKPYADQYNVNLQYKKLDKEIIIYADRSRLLQVMANLISNACKYSPKNENIEITAEKNNNMLQINITDHGQGIPESFKNNIFKKFQQADSSDTKAKGGTGLGLNITRSIVEHHNGKIWYNSTENVGTTFSFTIPLKKQNINT